jgi:CBS-domain-containing membrane protein
VTDTCELAPPCRDFCAMRSVEYADPVLDEPSELLGIVVLNNLLQTRQKGFGPRGEFLSSRVRDGAVGAVGTVLRIGRRAR